MFKLLKTWVQQAYGDIVVLPTPEEYSQRAARFTTADRMLAAAVLQSIVKNYDEWRTVTTGYVNTNLYVTYNETFRDEAAGDNHNKRRKYIKTLVNTSKDIRVDFVQRVVSRDSDGMVPWVNKGEPIIKINGITMEAGVSRFIVQEIDRFLNTKEEAERVAAKARRDAEENEKKWDMVERMLNMKRDEAGALVPLIQVED